MGSVFWESRVCLGVFRGVGCSGTPGGAGGAPGCPGTAGDTLGQLAPVHSVVFSAQAEDADGDTLMYVIDTASVSRDGGGGGGGVGAICRADRPPPSPTPASSASTSRTAAAWCWRGPWTSRAGGTSRWS